LPNVGIAFVVSCRGLFFLRQCFVGAGLSLVVVVQLPIAGPFSLIFCISAQGSAFGWAAINCVPAPYVTKVLLRPATIGAGMPKTTISSAGTKTRRVGSGRNCHMAIRLGFLGMGDVGVGQPRKLIPPTIALLSSLECNGIRTGSTCRFPLCTSLQ
jgi:hypothetical protein